MHVALGSRHFGIEMTPNGISTKFFVDITKFFV